MTLRNNRSAEYFEKAVRYMPGGVSSPVRSFGSVGGQAFVASCGEGPYLTDIDGNRYIDLVGSWGPLIHGHRAAPVVDAIEQALKKGVSFGVNCEDELRLSSLIVEKIPSVDMLRFVNSGTEACMSSIRVARAATKRDLIIKFEGHYHGHADSFLVSAGSGLATFGTSASAGVAEQTSSTTLSLPFNSTEALDQAFSEYGDRIAGVILEVVSGNMGVVLPDQEFLQKLRSWCTKNSSVLIFDEVMTGFRLSFAGAQGVYGIEPDLSCFGKVIGGGLPVGAYGGKEELMKLISPVGPVYQAGTLSGNPLGMAAGRASLELILEDEVLFYQQLDSIGSQLKAALESHIAHNSYPVSVSQIGSMLTLFFRSSKPQNFSEAKESDGEAFKKFFWALLKRGIYYPPSQFEACFLSSCHGSEILEELCEKSVDALDEVFASSG